MSPLRNAVALTLLLATIGLTAPGHAAPATSTALVSASAATVGRVAAPNLDRGDWEKQILQRTNTKRVSRGCTPLKLNKKLRKAARKHSSLMAESNTLSHQLPGEAGLGVRITRAGYRNWRGVAENIAYGYRTPAAMTRAWLRSPGHRRNILNCDYKHLGVGVTIKGGVAWATQDFGHK